MSTYVEVFGLTVLLGVVATLAGRLLAAALDVPLLRRPGPESLLVAAFLGTALLTLAYGWGVYAGLAAPGCLLAVGLLLSGLVAFLAARRRLGAVIRLPRPGWVGGVVLLALAARVAAYLLPLAMGSSCLHHCDMMLYVGTAEWLQTHGFGATPVPDPHQPVDVAILMLQDIGHRMGPMFLLALVRAAVPFRIAAELFPVLMAWGAALNVAGVFLLARWGLRVPRFYAAVGTAAVAVAFNSLSYSAAGGFFCQVYGTAALAFGLALLARLQAPVNWRPGNAALLGMTFAALVSLYSELSPVLALAALATGGRALWRARRRPGRLARFAGVTVLALAVAGNVEYVRAARAVLFMMNVPGGWPMPWGAFAFARFTLGFYPSYLFGGANVGRTYLLASALAGVAFLFGVARTFRRGRALPLAVALLTLGGLIAYYRFRAHDPWTGELGHTYRLFKLSQWVFTLVAALQVVGLWLVLRRLPRGRVVALLVCAVVACAAAPVQYRNARHIVATVRGASAPDVKLPDLRRLGERLDARAPSRLYYVSEPSGPWPRCFTAYILYPRPFASGWKGSAWLEATWLREDLPEAFEPGTVYFQHGTPPFAEPDERFPFDYSIIDGTRPLIFHLENPNGVEGPRGASATWLGTAPVGIFVFSPRACPAVLSFEAGAGPCLPETTRRSLRVTDGGGTAHEATVDTVGGAAVAFPVSLTPGINRLELRSLDRPTAVHPTDPRVMLVRVTKGRVDVAEPAPAESHPTSPGTE